MASLVQDIWIGSEPRLRARRLAPYEEAVVRILLHPDAGQTLDDPDLGPFVEALGARVDLVVFEPRGQGASGGRLGPEVVDDLRELVAKANHRWRDGLPLVLAGHGLGAPVALAVAAETDVRGVVLLGPGVNPLPPFLEALDLPGRLTALRVPLLAIDPRDGGGITSPEMMAAFTAQPRASMVVIPGGRRDALRPPWPEIVATWAAFVAGA
jgi:pimeloyl-ACP methyl ester carboxylesterase